MIAFTAIRTCIRDQGFEPERAIPVSFLVSFLISFVYVVRRRRNGEYFGTTYDSLSNESTNPKVYYDSPQVGNIILMPEYTKIIK